MPRITEFNMILKYLKPREWAMAAVCVVLIALNVYLELEIPGYMSSITATIETALMDPTIDGMDAVMDDGIMMVLCSIGSMITSVVVALLASYVAASLAKRLRELEFDKVQEFSAAEMCGFSVASLITRSTNDISQVQTVIAMGLQVMIKAPIMAVWAISKIVGKGDEWTITTAVAVIVVVVAILMVMLYVVPRFKRIQGLTDNVNRVTRENLTGIRVVRAYNAEPYQESKFDAANDDLTNTNLQANRALAFMYPVMSAVESLLSLAIYWIGAILINAAGGTIEQLTLFSNMVVFSSYAIQVVMSFILLVAIFMILPRAMVAARRIEEVIDTDPSVKDGPGAEPTETGTVEFRDVSFRYGGAPEDVIRDMSFTAERGETVAFIGPTGCGKTTMMGMVMRFQDVTGGQVLVDGVDVREYKLEDLRGRIGYVPQKAFMFKGTVESNVRYGDRSEDAAEEQVRKAVEIAQAKDFVESKEEGYSSPISQGGTNLSGGQKQRLSIARAVCRSPEIYIFDDSFSALDYKTDRTLRAALRKETAGTTTLIVAQRIGTIMDAAKIVVVDDGRIVGIGTHEELLRTCDTYLDIARSQLSEKELGL